MEVALSNVMSKNPIIQRSLHRKRARDTSAPVALAVGELARRSEEAVAASGQRAHWSDRSDSDCDVRQKACLEAASGLRDRLGQDTVHEPCAMSAASRSGVQAAVGSGVLRPLPVFVEDPRRARKDRAMSVLRGSLDAWLASDEGVQWRSQRSSLWLSGLSPGERKPP